MRNNGPVTNKEITLEDGTQIVSATDLKSRITHCNEDFVKYSGYTIDGIIGAPHNILRHPDMPQAAFAELWRRVQSELVSKVGQEGREQLDQLLAVITEPVAAT